MNTLFADFHIHVGEALGKPVKISAGRNLTLSNLLHQARYVKGLDVVTVIDGVCDHVLAEFQMLIDQGELTELPDGGYLYRGEMLVLLGGEIELKGPTGRAAHFGCWLPNMYAASDFNRWLKGVQRNTTLSSQLARTEPFLLADETHARGGLFVVHHAFTPFKGILGAAVERISHFVDIAKVDALELGLSADTDMADRIEHIRPLTFLSNSDAHGLGTIAREFNQIEMSEMTFDGVANLLRGNRDAARVTMNFGLHPAQGKYYRSRCRACGSYLADDAKCLCLSSRHHVFGVSNRIEQLADDTVPHHPAGRPPYRHIVPLQSIPGLGPAMYQRLIDAYGTELALYDDRVHLSHLAEVVGSLLANRVYDSLHGNVSFVEGGAGRYGRWQPSDG